MDMRRHRARLPLEEKIKKTTILNNELTRKSTWRLCTHRYAGSTFGGVNHVAMAGDRSDTPCAADSLSHWTISHLAVREKQVFISFLHQKGHVR